MRVKSNAVWHSLPGVIAAYQPIAAPDPLAARQNVAHSGARFGVYNAVAGVLPTWSAVTGWTFNGSSQYLATGIIPAINQSWSAVCRFSGATAKNYAVPFGVQDALHGNGVFGIIPNSTTYGRVYENPGALLMGSGTGVLAGVMGISRNAGYLNGIAEAGTIPATPTTANVYPIFIGSRNQTNTPALYFNGSVRCLLIASRPLTPSEVWLASRQMAYAEQNPNWNAWSRRRMYFYAPSAAVAGRVGIYGRRGAVALPGGVRIGTVNDA